MPINAKLDNPSIRARIVEMVRRGNYVSTAAESCGVNANTLKTWLKRGQDVRSRWEDGEPIDRADEIYAEFHAEVTQARALSEQDQVAALVDSDDTRCAQWLLERKYPKKWGATLSIASESEMARFLRRIEEFLPKDLYERVLVVAAEVSADERSAEAPGSDEADDGGRL